MSDEEKKAIEILKDKLFNYNLNKEMNLLDKMTEQGIKECEALETVLNLIEKQQKEIEYLNSIREQELKQHKQTKKSLKGQIEKKDKIIDMMSYAMTHEEVPQDKYCIIRTMACEVMGGNRECKECIKHYFERKVEE